MNAIVTIAIGNRHQSIFELTRPSMEAYAKKIGAELVVIGDSERAAANPEFEKFQIFGLLNKFKRVAFLEADVMVRPDCPNLFEVVPEGEFGAFNEGEFADFTSRMSEIVKHTETEIQKWDKQYYNTGVMVASRCHKFLFEPPEIELQSMCEQFINLRLIKSKTKVHHLDYKLNRIKRLDLLTGEPRHAGYLLHYAGMKNLLPLDSLLSLIRSDLEKWASSDGFKFKRNILVKTHGGLGDEICAEPVVRYLAEKAYPDADITVATWFPRLFEHLPVKVVGINDFKPAHDTPYYVMETLVPPENPAWAFMSANLMHGTDFMSQMCLRAILPDADKQIKLSVKIEDIQEVVDVIGIRPLSELVLVHPGKGWPSKSFPKEWWDKVISGLTASGLPVVLIGKYLSDDQGLVDVDLPSGVIDARNLLSLGGLIALISQARVLISNDSSPVHIAAAFDNEIVLIPTCKHPDHVLAIRNGSRGYKARSLYKALICDAMESTPTQVHGKTIDKVPGDIYDYLPAPEEVVAAAKEAHGKEE